MLAYAGDGEKIVIRGVKNRGELAEAVDKGMRELVCVLLRNSIIEQKLKDFVRLKAVNPLRKEAVFHTAPVFFMHTGLLRFRQ